MRRWPIVIVALAQACATPASAPVAANASGSASASGSVSASGSASAPADATLATPIDAPLAAVAAAPAPDAAAAPSVHIVDAPMAWSDARARLTLDYRRQHSDPTATDLVIAPRAIVLHFTDGNSAKSTRAYFDNPRIEASRPELARAGAVNVSSHFVVDRDGTIYRLQPETRFARHCIGLNHVAIGIENVGDEKRWPLTDAQVAADVALVRDLSRRFPITHLFGHYEVMQLRGRAVPAGETPLYVERDPSYRNDKDDPGARFMARVRAEITDLGLRGVER